MMTAAAALALAAMTAAAASANERVSGVRHISSGPFRAGAAAAQPVGEAAPAVPSGGLAAAPAHAPHGAIGRPRAFVGRSAGFASPSVFAASRRSGSASPHFSLSHWMFARGGLRRIDGGSAGAAGSGSANPGSGGSTSASDPQQLPYGAFGTIPGALIRTEGLGFLYAPGDGGRFFTVEAGDRIAYQENLGHPIGTTGVFMGRPDTLPSANPHGDASGVTAITPNDESTISIDNTSSGGGIHDYGRAHTTP